MKSIIELKAIVDFTSRIYVDVIGYYTTYDNVIEQIKDLSEGRIDHIMFHTYEYRLDIVDKEIYFEERIVSERQYKIIDGEVVLIHETLGEYKGHTENEYSFKRGDIINYIGYEDNIYTGIVCNPPISKEEAEKRQLTLDNLDDSYLVYELGDGNTHDHVRTINIIGLADISEEQKKLFEDKLKERLEIQEKNLK